MKNTIIQSTNDISFKLSIKLISRWINKCVHVQTLPIMNLHGGPQEPAKKVLYIYNLYNYPYKYKMRQD